MGGYRLKNNRGFTLVELIVVLAILAIIGTIAVPKLLGIQQEAKEQALYISAKSVYEAFEFELACNPEFVEKINETKKNSNNKYGFTFNSWNGTKGLSDVISNRMGSIKGAYAICCDENGDFSVIYYESNECSTTEPNPPGLSGEYFPN